MGIADQYKLLAAKVAHVDYLSSFGRESFIDAYKSTLPREELETYTAACFNASAIRDEIERDKAMYFVCMDLQSLPCGYSKLLPSPPPACIGSNGSIELQRLYVDRRHMGKGIGKLLAQHGERVALQRAYSYIWLRVWEGNRVARKIYRKWNYTEQGTDSYPVGREKRTVVVMEKILKPPLDPNY